MATSPKLTTEQPPQIAGAFAWLWVGFLVAACWRLHGPLHHRLRDWPWHLFAFSHHRQQLSRSVDDRPLTGSNGGSLAYGTLTLSDCRWHLVGKSNCRPQRPLIRLRARGDVDYSGRQRHASVTGRNGLVCYPRGRLGHPGSLQCAASFSPRTCGPHSLPFLKTRRPCHCLSGEALLNRETAASIAAVAKWP